MSQFRQSILNPVKFNLFKLKNLPLAFVAGLKINELTDQQAVVSIKHNYFTKNPFRSMYFAAQAMAAELSTGVLVMDAVQQVKPKRISMLVKDMRADFSKKATGRIQFTCTNGKLLQETIEFVLANDEGKTIEMQSVGTDEANDVVSIFTFTWTLKEKV